MLYLHENLEKFREEKALFPLLETLKSVHLDIFGTKLTGIYLHGSLAFGCFRWENSDIDFLTVVNAPVTESEKQALLAWILSVQELCPPKGLEMSIVEEHCCQIFRYPTPYLFHYSNGHLENAMKDPAAYCAAMHGTDPDLAAHLTVTRAVGIPLYGPATADLFAPVPAGDYLSSLLYDVENMEGDIAAAPVYCTLNLCRVLAYCRDGKVLSKAEGALWGLTHLEPVWHPILRQAADAYRFGTAMTAEEDTLHRFAVRCLGEIRKAIPKQ